MLAIFIGLFIGIILPMQTAINSKLRTFVQSPFTSSMISFTVGTIYLAVMTLISGKSLFLSAETFSDNPWWIWLGGLLGVFYLTSNILLFPKLGGVQTVIMPISGQIIMSMLIDNFGWFASAVHPFGLTRLVGTIILVAGLYVTIVLPDQLEKKNTIEGEKTYVKEVWFWRLVGVLAGMISATQIAINGHLGTVLDSSIHASFISFLLGSVILIVLVGIKERGYKQITLAIGPGKAWWVWLGGVIGGTYVLGTVYLVPVLGTGAAVVIALFGQMIGGILVDSFGLLGAKKNPVVLAQIIGLIIMIIGVILIKLT